ncbi:MAG TPA: potassium/proton antiporter [Solirubrobacterales bacterium]|nr:potassium/proton antiporter [Solirubrobacterales bacterium]
MNDSELILVAGLMLAAGLAAAKVADRVRVPGLLLFLGLGMLVGSDGIGGVEFSDYELTRTLGTIGLILILFEGGLTAGWNEIKPVLGTAVSLATLGTVLTALLAGLAAMLLLDLGTLEGLIIGSAVAATDSAAIFAVLRGSQLRRRLARALEGESGMNDPVALLLVTGFIEWVETPGFNALDLAGDLVLKLGIGLLIGVGLGYLAREAFRRLDLPSPGLYPVASVATAALAYGVAEVAHGSGFLSVYIAALVLGTGPVPARRTTIAFHQGLSWVAQISLFFLLGLLVFPSELGEVAVEGLLLSAALMLVARPLAAYVASALAPFEARERLMLGWAGLRGAIPIWLATFPVIEGIEGSADIFNTIFFVVVTSTLVQGATFEPLARRLGVTADEPSLPRPLVETGIIRRLGGESFVWRVEEADAAVGHTIKELGLPREALVNVIVRGETAIPPRGSTEIEAGDELHIVVRQEALAEVERLTERWRTGPVGEPPVPALPPRGAPQVFTVRPWRREDGDPGRPEELEGVAVAARLRSRRDTPGALFALADGRYAVTGSGLVAVGPRRQLAAWASRRADREGISPQERAWWQEVTGAVAAPARPALEPT